MAVQVALKSAAGVTDGNLEQATPGEAKVARLRTKPKSIPAPASPVDAARETNGITSRLVLLYVDQVGGQETVDQVLARCGMSDRRDDLLNENYWFLLRQEDRAVRGCFGCAGGSQRDAEHRQPRARAQRRR
jgi:hypothetical protein